MATGKARGAKPYASKAKKKDHGHVKDARRAAASGREAQGLGSAGRSGGTKSSGGHAGRPKGSPVATTRPSMRSAGGKPAGKGAAKRT